MSLSTFGVSGKVIALPGHTVGSVGILLNSGELFVGDAMQNFGTPACAWCYENREASEETIKTIEALHAKMIYFGHGKNSKFP